MDSMESIEYQLYSSPFSLYSMMARHTIQLGPTTQGAIPPGKITLVFVNHRQNGALEEHYLLNVNPKGQVPSMTGATLEGPLTDSHSISLFLAEEHYPAMLPTDYKSTIKGLMARLHAVSGPSISNKNPTTAMTQHNVSPAEEILKRDSLGAEYRKALENKVKLHNENYGKAFQPAVVEKARADLQDIFADVVELRKQAGSYNHKEEWTFGSQVGPTVLDSHLLPFTLRCIDADNAELVPSELQRWALAKSQTPEWFKVMHGRSTQWDPSMGPIADMKEMMTL